MPYDVELQRTADRLRQLSPARLLPREREVREVLQAMTDREIPRVDSRAWGDQLLVVGREVPPDLHERIERLLVELRRGFDLMPGGVPATR